MKKRRSIYAPVIVFLAIFVVAFVLFIQPKQIDHDIKKALAERFGNDYTTQYYGSRDGNLVDKITMKKSGKTYLVEYTKWSIRSDTKIVAVSDFKEQK